MAFPSLAPRQTRENGLIASGRRFSSFRDFSTPTIFTPMGTGGKITLAYPFPA